MSERAAREAAPPRRIASGTNQVSADPGSVTSDSRASQLLGRVQRITPVVATAVLIATIAASPTAVDRPVPWSAHHALRKDREDADPTEGGELSTLATLFNIHTGDVLPLSDHEPTDTRFSEHLADRVTGEQTDLDPRLLDLLRRIARRNPGARIELVSGFRSPKLNEMLRKKGHNVASHSQHSLGHACDFRIVGLTPAQMKQEVLSAGWDGGIGRYDKRSDWFVHADVGRKRHWNGK